MEANSELLIFVTPYVIETTDQMLPQARRELDDAQRRLRQLEAELKPLREQDEPPADSNSSDPLSDVKLTPRDKTKDTDSNSPASGGRQHRLRTPSRRPATRRRR